MMRSIRWPVMALAAGLVVVATAGPALACGGLVAPNGTVRLGNTATLAAYHDGLEHYVTSFEFSGQGSEVGSITPLPGIPSKVERGGDWTLQRLEREIPRAKAFAASAGSGAALAARDATVVYETKVDALDIVILKGGAAEVGSWARKHGYLLPPDSPQVLDFYARRSPIFMAARFDAAAAQARGQGSGDGTPIHLTIPTANPWVPLRILTLGRGGEEQVQADVFVLTDRRPTFAPRRLDILQASINSPASDQLLTDLRSDKGMDWVPNKMWLTAISIDTGSADLHFDLAIDASGRGRPSAVDTGLVDPRPAPTTTTSQATPPTSVPAITAKEAVALDSHPASSNHNRLPLALSAVTLAGLLSVAGAAWSTVRRWSRPG